VRLRYGIGEPQHTLQDVAGKLHITRERVRQIQVKAEEKLGRVVVSMGHYDEDPGELAPLHVEGEPE
jgi:DNA-directed RNA polymerase sigma subunit (sigma70/sigma32)